MRPVNLIPPEDRRGDRAPLRSGPLSYVVIGGLAVALLAVTGLVTTKNSIVEREAEVASLEAERDAAVEQAARLAPYAEFASLRQTRESTLLSLAQSRFDWERVLRELALVIPSDVTLTTLAAAASGESAAGATGEGAQVPELVISGCASNHEAVASFVAALEDIDGVTRVGLSRSERPVKVKATTDSVTGDSAGVDVGSDGACGEANSYDVTAVFDNAAVTPVDPSVAPATPADPAAAAGTPAETNSVEEQTTEAKKKARLIQGASTP